jgi:hypothetical protein
MLLLRLRVCVSVCAAAPAEGAELHLLSHAVAPQPSPTRPERGWPRIPAQTEPHAASGAAQGV